MVSAWTTCAGTCAEILPRFQPSPPTVRIARAGKVDMIVFSACVSYEALLTYVYVALADIGRCTITSEDSGMDESSLATEEYDGRFSNSLTYELKTEKTLQGSLGGLQDIA